MNRWLYGFLVLVVGVGIGGALTLRGQTPGPWNAKNGVALHGYDVVAYVEEQRPVKGSRSFAHSWQGVTWHFASAAARDKFAAAPDKYAPAYGGFCAYGVSKGYAVDIDPEAFAVEGGRLYLNYSRRVQRLWNEDRPGRIRQADQNWPTVKADLEKK